MRLAQTLGALAGLSLVTTITWLGFAPGAARCTGSLSFFGLGRSGPGSCWPFAAAAVFFWLIVIALVVRWLRNRK